jgi:hypothetical protein
MHSARGRGCAYWEREITDWCKSDWFAISEEDLLAALEVNDDEEPVGRRD